MFNRDISGWATSALTDTSRMFKGATAFDQDLGGWDVTQVTDAEQMFEGIALSTANYDALLTGWSSQALQSNVIFGGGESQYCNGVDGIQILRNTFNWIVSDFGILPEGTLDNNGLDIADSCGTTDDNFSLSSSGGNLIISNSNSAFNVSGDEVTQQDENTVAIPIGEITTGLTIDGGEGDNDITIDSSFDLIGANNGLTLSNLNVNLTGSDDLEINSLNVAEGDFNTSGVNTVVDTVANFNSGSSLSGDGNIIGDVNMNPGSTLNAGNSPGILNTGNLTLDNSNNEFEVTGTTPGTEHDKVVATGTVIITSGTSLNLLGGYANGVGDEIVLIDNDGTDAISGTFDTLTEGTEITFGDFTGTISYTGGDGNDIVLIGTQALIPGAFITTWQTTVANESITIPTAGSGYNYTVDWGDGMSDTGVMGNATHTYVTPGIHTVSISGDFPRIYFNFVGDREKILTVDQWGGIAWQSMVSAFSGCSNLEVLASDAPDLSNVSSLQTAFKGCINFNQDINHWNVSTITNLVETFFVSSYNQPLNNWDVSNVTNFSGTFKNSPFNLDIGNWDVSSALLMEGMFANSDFNQDIGNWNVSNVTNMFYMFFNSPFNQNIGNWNVSNVVAMLGMFQGASSFNQDISNWNVSNVTNMREMFRNASSFNQDIGAWDLSSLSNMRNMFDNATAFDQDLSAWDISSLTNATDMFKGVTLSQANYDALLNGWATLDPGETLVPSNIIFSGGNSQYCDGEPGKTTLEGLGWTITDGGLAPQNTYYLDNDGDGFGDPDNSIMACSQPAGYVPNSDDCADFDPLASQPGDACDDGNACTINDVYDNDCNCVGEPIDPDDDDPCTTDSCDPTTGEIFNIPIDIPDPVISGNTTVCSGDTTTLMATNSGGTTSWYSDDTGTALITTGTSFTTPALTSDTTYYVEEENGDSCSSNLVAVTVTVTPKPQVIITAIAPILEGDSGTTILQFEILLDRPSTETIFVEVSTADVTATDGIDYFGFSNTVVNFSPGQISQPVNVQVNGDTDFEPDETFTVTIVNASECSEILVSEATGTILNDDADPCMVSIDNQPEDATICDGDSLSFDLVATGTGTLSYQWQVDDGLGGGFVDLGAPSATSGLNFVMMAIGGNGNQYRVIVTADNNTPGDMSDDCSVTSAVATLTVNPIQTPAFSITTTYCSGDLGDSLSKVSDNGITGDWLPATIDTSILGDTDYVFTPDDPSQCGEAITLTVTVNPLPEPVITGPTDYCLSAGPVILDAGAGFASYLWSPGGETTQTISATEGSYTVTVTDSNGCSATSDEFTVIENPLPTVTATASTLQICEGESVTLTGGGAVSYSWDNNVTDGQAFTPTETTTYTITGTADNGCTNTAEVTVTVNPLPATPTGETLQVACEDSSANTLVADYDFTYGNDEIWSGSYGTSAIPNYPGLNYLTMELGSNLSFDSNGSALGDGGDGACDGILPTGTNVSIGGYSYLPDGQSVLLTNNSTTNVFINYRDDISGSGSYFVCGGNSALLDLTILPGESVTLLRTGNSIAQIAESITAIATPPAGSSLVWYDAESGGSQITDPTQVGIGSSIFWATSVDDTTGCESAERLMVTLEVFDLPSVTFTAPADFPVNAGVQLGLGGGTPEGGVYSGLGVIDDGNGQTYSFDPAAAGIGVHTISYTYTDLNSCSASANDDVEVTEPAPIPEINIIGPTIVDEDAGTATYSVTMSAVSATQVSVDFATVDGTATGANDYSPNDGTLIFAIGETEQTITVVILNDVIDEPDESFSVVIYNVQGNATLGTSTQVTTILDNDNPCDNDTEAPQITGLENLTVQCPDELPLTPLEVNSSTNPIESTTIYGNAVTFGPSLFEIPISGDLILVDDGVSNPSVTDACEPIINDLSGKIAVIDRGACAFVTKVLNAQNAGAVAVIIVNNQPGDAIVNMSGEDPNITIPSISVSNNYGNALKAEIALGNVNVSFPGPSFEITDNCEINTVDLTQNIVQGDCINNYTIENIYTVTDIAGNVTTETQTITVNDETPPNLIDDCPIPADFGFTDVLSQAELPTANDIEFALLTQQDDQGISLLLFQFYADNCGGLSELNVLDPVITGDACSGTATYAIEVIDACGNVNNECSFTINYGFGNTPPLVFDDMEHGDPFANGWFSFSGSVGGGGIGVNTGDLPPVNGDVFSLETGWGSGGVPGFFGGFGRSNTVDISQATSFDFWINPDPGQDYTLEINLQDDDDNDGNADDEFQYNLAVSPVGPGAISGGGWQLISVPLTAFFDDNSFLTGGNGTLDGTILTVVVAVISNSGADVNFRTDYWSFTNTTSFVWTGALNTDWENPGNWQNSNAPGLSVGGDVTIPLGMPNYPVLTVGQDLYIDPCSTVFVDLKASLTVNPNVVVTNDGTVINDGNTTFESDETGSAYIGSGEGMFIGDFTAERFIPAKRAYRQLSPPVTTSTPISENWQQYTHITGPAGNTDGFDVTLTGNPSMYIFDNDVYSYLEVENTNATNLFPGTMYHILIRGDRNTDLGDNNAAPSITTLKATGELTAENQGSKTIEVNVPEQRFMAVGNPFQSQIDMDALLTTSTANIEPVFYWVWDPTLGFRGAYVAVVASAGIPSTGDSDANQYLQAGQAGWVYTAGAGPSSVTFTQDSKFTAGPETSIFRNGSGLASVGQLRLSLYENSALANGERATDGILILFDTVGNNGVDAFDALNITNLDENFATSNDGELLSIENRAIPQEEDVIQLETNTYRSTSYTIVSEGIAMEGPTAYLYDSFTGIYTEIPQTGEVSYSYSVDEGNPLSVEGDRFSVVFAGEALSVDDYDIGQIELYPNPTNIGKFYLDVPVGMDDLEVTIYSTLGLRLYHEKGFTGGSTLEIETGTLFSLGTYFVELSSQGKTITKKLIIN